MSRPDALSVIDDVNSRLKILTEHLSIIIKSPVGGLSEADRSIQIVLSLLRISLSRTRKRIDAGQLEIPVYEGLLPAVKTCQAKLDELTTVLKGIESEKGSWRRWSFSRPDSNGSRNEKAQNVAAGILEIHITMCRSGATPPTAEEISHITSPQVVATLSQSLQAMMQQLREVDAPKSPPPIQSNDSTVPIQQISKDSQDITVVGPDEVNKYFNLYNAQVVDYLDTSQGPVARAIEGRKPGQITLEPNSPTLPWTSSATSNTNPGTAAIQFEDSQPTLIVHEVRDYSPQVGGDDDTKVLSTAESTAEEAMSILADALGDIRFANGSIYTFPGVAQLSYISATHTLTPFHPSDPFHLLQKHRYLTACSLGLTMICKPAGPYIQEAYAHNDAAVSVAIPNDSIASTFLSSLTATAGITLDKAFIKSRDARIREYTRSSSSASIRALRLEAFSLLQQVIQDIRSQGCVNFSDWDTLAQAQIGCGRIARRVYSRRASLWGRNRALAAVGKAEEYFKEAVESVRKGLEVGKGNKDEKEGLEEIGEVAKKGGGFMEWG